MFEVQISNPTLTGCFDKDDSTLNEAIQTIFAFGTEQAFFNWNHVYIPLDYKYDISEMINDILLIRDNLTNQEEGSFQVQWKSNTFPYSWDILFSQNTVKINLTIMFEEFTHLACVLQKNANIQVEKNAFIHELEKLINFIREKLTCSGYDTTNLPEMDCLNFHRPTNSSNRL